MKEWSTWPKKVNVHRYLYDHLRNVDIKELQQDKKVMINGMEFECSNIIGPYSILPRAYVLLKGKNRKVLLPADVLHDHKRTNLE